MLDRSIPDLIRQSVSLVDVVSRRVRLVKRGRMHSGSCPFHQEKTPSFVVYDDGRYQCFGCGARGDAIDFLMRLDSMSFQDAVRSLGGDVAMPEISPEEKARIKAAAAKRERDQLAKTARDQADAAGRALKIWNSAKECETHPYLTRKGIASYGLRTDSYWRYINGGTVKIPQALLVPMYSGRGQLASLQAVFPGSDNPLGRDRDFLPGGRKDGCYFRIGRPGDAIVVCEGYATGASVHQATGLCVMVAMTAGNLLAVSRLVRAALPAATIVLAADDDAWTAKADGRPYNPGIEYATAAAQDVKGLVVFPVFSCPARGLTDFNDLHAVEGIEVVRRQILGGVGI